MRNVRHWTPEYIFDRLSLAFFMRRNPDAPWITPQMISLLNSWLRVGDIGFEWGSGRSTVWFAERVQRLTSVEHDPTWYSEVSSRLSATPNRSRVSLIKADLNVPLSYINAISDIEDEALDFCLVDGRLRARCALRALPKIRPGGALIVDDIQRYIPPQIPTPSPNQRSHEQGPISEEWAEFQREIAIWRCIWTTSGVSDTALWIKPGSYVE